MIVLSHSRRHDHVREGCSSDRTRLRKYRSAPLYKDRLRYLVHVADGGAAPRTLYKIAYCQLNLVGLLDLREGETVTFAPAHRRRRGAGLAARNIPAVSGPSRGRQASSSDTLFDGCVFWTASRNPPKLATPTLSRLERSPPGCATSEACRKERSTAGVRAVVDFLNRLAVRNVPLTAAEITDVDEFLAAKMASGSCKRATINNYARYLRAFLCFGEDRGFCRSGLAEGVIPSRVYKDDTIPMGLPRDDVRRLLASTEGERPVDKRGSRDPDASYRIWLAGRRGVRPAAGRPRLGTGSDTRSPEQGGTNRSLSAVPTASGRRSCATSSMSAPAGLNAPCS